MARSKAKSKTTTESTIKSETRSSEESTRSKRIRNSKSSKQQNKVGINFRNNAISDCGVVREVLAGMAADSNLNQRRAALTQI